MTRQRFLQWLLGSTAWCAGLAFGGWPILRFVTWQERRVRKVVFAAPELAPYASRDGVILIPRGKSLQALSARCTHLGCRVEYDQAGEELVCPCHKSAYDLQGKRLRGPARADLAVLETRRLDDGGLEVVLPVRG
jgi:cytochrome b6-f complex iron-sulfur subunit